MLSAPFPPELLDLVVQNIEDTRTLLACTLSSRTFNAISHRRLLHTVCLRVRSRARRRRSPCTGLLEALQRKPQLASAIAQLTIVDKSGLDWTRTDSALPDLLLALHHLQAFSFHYDMGWWKAEPIDFYSLSPRLRSAIMHVLRSPSLANLRLQGILSLPPAILHSPPALKSLQMTAVSFRNQSLRTGHLAKIEPETLDVSGGSMASLTDMRIRTVALAIAADQSAFDVSRVHTLSLDVQDQEDHLYCQMLIDACAGSLTHLGFSPATQAVQRSAEMSSIHYFPHPTTLNNLSRLQSLRLDVSLDQPPPHAPRRPEARVHDPIPWLIRILRSIKLPNVLETIVIRIELEKQELHTTFTPKNWERLDRALAAPELNSLKEVHIVLMQYWRKNFGPTRRPIEEQLRRVHGRGVLRVWQNPNSARNPETCAL